MSEREKEFFKNFEESISSENEKYQTLIIEPDML